MRQEFNILVFLIVAAYSTAADTVEVDTVELDIGDELPLSVRTVGHLVNGCYIVTPHGETIEFRPKNGSIENRYVLSEPNPMSECQVSVIIVDEHDAGEWSIYYTSSEGKVFEDKIHVAIKGVSNTISSTTLEVSTGALLPLRLNTIGLDFDSCFLTTPQNEDIEFMPKNNSVANRYQLLEGNPFSACQVDVKITDEKDSGTWSIFVSNGGKKLKEHKYIVTVTGSYHDNTEKEEDDGREYRITTLNPVTRAVNLDTTTQLNVQVQVKKGSFLQCGIRDSKGSLIRDGENGVTPIDLGSQMACRYDIGPLTDSMLGQYTVFLRYSVKGVFHEVQQNFNLLESGHDDDVDEEEDDGHQYRITTLNPVTRSVNLDTITQLNVQVQVKKGSFLQCGIRNSKGSLIKDGENGVTPIDLGSQMACRYDIGPLTDSMLGQYTVFLRYSVKGVFHEVQQLFTVRENDHDDDDDEEEDDGRHYTITNRDPVLRIINLGTTTQLDVQATVKTGSFEGCGIRDSKGNHVKDGENGVTQIHLGSQIACRYNLGPLTESMLHQWTVFLRYSQSGQFTEVRQMFDIQKEDPSMPIEAPNMQITDLVPLEFTGSLGFEKEVSITGHKKSQIASCHIRTPAGLQYTVMDGFNVPGVKAESTGLLCKMTVNLVSDEMFGEWMLIARRSQYKSNQGVEERLRVTFLKESASPENNGPIHRLTRINYIVKPEMIVEISLRKSHHDVSCELRKPHHGPNDEHNHKIKVIDDKHNPFATCRALIGPIDESLLGDWELCQKYDQPHDHTQEECQPASLTWNNGSPHSHWQIHTQPTFDHVVNFGGTLRTGVIDSATIRTCHVITPDGNDIVVNQDSEYPYITRLTPFTQCSISIGPINDKVFGDWVVYGIYSGFQGVSERRLPVHMFLYDPNNPYEQAYNITNLNPVIRTINLGTSIDLEVTVSASKAVRDACSIRSPDGIQTQDNLNEVMVIDVGSRIACQYRLDPISESTLGEWEVSLKYQLDNMFTEVRQVFVVKREDPENPIFDGRPIEYLHPLYIDAHLGSRHVFEIYQDNHQLIETCHIRTPDGLLYTIMDGFNIPGIEASTSSYQCRVTMEVDSPSMIGQWTLIARKAAKEERMNITIDIEEIVKAEPNVIHIYENTDLLLRLAEVTDLYETCQLYAPNDSVYELAEKNPNYPKQCGFIVRKVTKELSGTWKIVYGNEIHYTAFASVNVLSPSDYEFPPLTWNAGDQFSGFIGPDNVKYCKVVDPTGLIVFDNFGRCKLDVKKITHKHDGAWVVSAGLEGKMLLEDHAFGVKVRGTQIGKTPTVKTLVEITPSTIVLSCSVYAKKTTDVCKFQNSDGKVLIPTIGVSEENYAFFGNGSRRLPGVFENNCGIRITNPAEEDWGIWRCAVSTPEEVIYGFLTAVKPESNTGARNKSEPILKVNKEVHEVIQDEEVLITCNIMAPIHHCYFRNENGSVYNLHPGVQSDEMEYYGAGLSAGECGLRFKSITTKDSGRWSCIVGFADHSTEQRQEFNLVVLEKLQIEQFEEEQLIVKTTVSHPNRESAIVLQFKKYSPTIEHCRYVRIDAFAFTSEDPPPGYSVTVNDNDCSLYIHSPSILDHHPWFVTVRVAVHNLLNPYNEEYSGTSRPTLPDRTTPAYRGTSIFWFWGPILLMMVSIPLLVMSIGPKKHREWTYDKFSSMRRSFRSGARIIPGHLPINYVNPGQQTKKIPLP